MVIVQWWCFKLLQDEQQSCSVRLLFIVIIVIVLWSRISSRVKLVATRCRYFKKVLKPTHAKSNWIISAPLFWMQSFTWTLSNRFENSVNNPEAASDVVVVALWSGSPVHRHRKRQLQRWVWTAATTTKSKPEKGSDLKFWQRHKIKNSRRKEELLPKNKRLVVNIECREKRERGESRSRIGWIRCALINIQACG